MTLQGLVREAQALIETANEEGASPRSYPGGFRDGLQWFIDGLLEIEELGIEVED